MTRRSPRNRRLTGASNASQYSQSPGTSAMSPALRAQPDYYAGVSAMSPTPGSQSEFYAGVSALHPALRAEPARYVEPTRTYVDPSLSPLMAFMRAGDELRNIGYIECPICMCLTNEVSHGGLCHHRLCRKCFMKSLKDYKTRGCIVCYQVAQRAALGL
ncbi:hypothetical protein SCHPADRAFT_624311 [Schizopora paradoxa]|uniref:RING-type domain-containing protein n=1 Tax=Schizopora paradoxa TaxID=27342 RepID=A0A0H2R871_9AGAM|nr:hypothetical protein SCHPADRAFT_624311 [Schizopora paradoxa]